MLDGLKVDTSAVRGRAPRQPTVWALCDCRGGPVLLAALVQNNARVAPQRDPFVRGSCRVWDGSLPETKRHPESPTSARVGLPALPIKPWTVARHQQRSPARMFPLTYVRASHTFPAFMGLTHFHGSCAARGEGPPVTAEAKVWMSLETLVRLLTSENRKLLSIMARERPRSVSALADRVGRDQGNVSRAIGRLAEAGFVRLVPDGREKRPEVAIERLHIDLDLVNDRLAIARSRPAGPGDPDTADRRQSP